MQTILLLDNDVLARANLSRALARLPGLQLLHAASLAEARLLLEHVEIELVMSELLLPDGSLRELLPELRHKGRDVHVLAVSRHLRTHGHELPDGVPRLAAPADPGELTARAVRALGRVSVDETPCSLPDCMQIACSSRRSLELEVLQGGVVRGTVEIREGEPWCARDAAGEGTEALGRLLALPAAGVVCGPVSLRRRGRNLAGAPEHLLLEAARVLDEAEREQGFALGTRPPAPAASFSAVPDVVLGEGSSQTAKVETFERYFEEGIEHLLARRLAEAFGAFSRARELGTSSTLEVNLSRLRQLGFS